MPTTTTYRLIADADLSHEDARSWYDSYGWHLTTDECGDVCLQACEYDWLDDDTGVVAMRHLCREIDGLTTDDAESIAQMAVTVRAAAEEGESLLEDAVTAYQRGDVAACVAALDACRAMELDHGDAPASEALRSQLVEAVEIDRDEIIAAIEAAALVSPEQVADLCIDAAEHGRDWRAVLARAVEIGEPPPHRPA